MAFLRTLGRWAGRAAPVVGFINPAVGVAMAGAGMLAGSGGGGGGEVARVPNEEAMWKNRFTQALTGMQTADEAELARLRDIDPAAGFAEQTEAQLAAQDEDFAERYANQLGSMVGAGRLPTKSGFGLRDAQQTILQGQRERASIEQRNAAAAAEARRQHAYRVAEYGAGARNRYLDAISGRFNTMEAQRLQDEAERRRNRAGILGGVIQGAATLGGAYLGSRGGRRAYS